MHNSILSCCPRRVKLPGTAELLRAAHGRR
jgi:hypothetical protein